MPTITHKWEDEDNNRTLTFEVSGRASAVIPAQIYGPPESCYPAEGGELQEIEDVELRDAKFYDDDGNEIRTFADLSKEEIEAIQKEIEAAIWDDSSLYSAVEEKIVENSDHDYNPWDDF